VKSGNPTCFRLDELDLGGCRFESGLENKVTPASLDVSRNQNYHSEKVISS